VHEENKEDGKCVAVESGSESEVDSDTQELQQQELECLQMKIPGNVLWEVFQMRSNMSPKEVDAFDTIAAPRAIVKNGIVTGFR
jgi:hypothetical protein